MSKAYLCNKHEPLLLVDADKGKIFKILEIRKDNIHLFPILFQNEKNITVEKLNKWMDTRKIPEAREGLKEARMRFRGFENYRNMFGLSDQYWLRFVKKETWDGLNFFTNKYDQSKGLLFFEPWRVDPDKAKKSLSPDLTTNGVLRKQWIQDEDLNSYLLKAGSVKYHQEPLSEVLASLILRDVGIIDYVEYELVIHGLRFCSKCANFISADTEFVPASHLYKLEPRPKNVSRYEHFVKMCKNFGINDAPEYIQKMTAADYILCNSDRHFGNFGFIRDAQTGKILGFAPLFDFGRAYWGFAQSIQDKNKEGKENKEEISKFFSDIEEESFKKTVKSLEKKEFPTIKTLEKMVERYPNISDNQVLLINQKIRKAGKEFEKEMKAKNGKEKDEAITR